MPLTPFRVCEKLKVTVARCTYKKKNGGKAVIRSKGHFYFQCEKCCGVVGWGT